MNLSSADKLRQSLLCRNDDTRRLQVNFDGALVRLLREVKYFLQFDLAVPSNALSIYEKGDTYRQQIIQLDMIGT
jgi:dynein heavy chain